LKKYSPALADKNHPEHDYDFPVPVLREDDVTGTCYLASEVDALLAEIKRVAYGYTVWRDVFALIDGAADSADDVNGTETI
jgi:hypothetical protein